MKKVTNETIEKIKEKRQFLSDSESPYIVEICEELQQLREALTWKPATEGINPECDVFEVKLGSEICNVYTALIVGEYYQIGGVDNLREGFYFGQWDLESLLEDYPNFSWREIVEVPTDLPEVE